MNLLFSLSDSVMGNDKCVILSLGDLMQVDDICAHTHSALARPSFYFSHVMFVDTGLSKLNKSTE